MKISFDDENGIFKVFKNEMEYNVYVKTRPYVSIDGPNVMTFPCVGWYYSDDGMPMMEIFNVTNVKIEE